MPAQAGAILPPSAASVTTAPVTSKERTAWQPKSSASWGASLPRTPGHLGEVLVEIARGQKFLARGADREATIPKDTQVVVVGSLGGRTIEVVPARSMR